MNKRNQLSYKILKIIGFGVLVTAGSILAPTLPYALLRAFVKKKLGSKYTDKQINSSVKYLKRKKLIAFKSRQNKIIISKPGKRHLAKLNIDKITIPQQSWDGRWRLLTFDIPEPKRKARRVFREKLKNLDFFHFQRSVFVFPYRCKDEINNIAETLNIQDHIHILVCDRFTGDRQLVKKFKL